MGLSHSSTGLALEQVTGLWTLWVQQILPEGFGKEAQGLCHFKPFCPHWQQWNRDFAEFQKKVEDANKQLAAIFCQGFDDCNRLSAAVKVPVPQLSSPARSSHRDWGSSLSPVLGLLQGAGPSACLSLLQLVHMFASVLERPLIRAEASPCHLALLGMFEAELESVKALYDTRTVSPPPPGGAPAIHKNLPPVAGQLKWALELQQRLEGPYKDLLAIDHP